jgi:hypothetical protein
VQSDMLDKEQLLHKQALLQLITASTPSPSLKGSSTVTSPLPSPTPSMSSLHYFSALASLKTTPALVTPEPSRMVQRAQSADTVTPVSYGPFSPSRLPPTSIAQDTSTTLKEGSDQKNDLSDVTRESTTSTSTSSAIDALSSTSTPPHAPSPISTSAHKAAYGIVRPRPPPFTLSTHSNTYSTASNSTAASLGSPRKSPIRTPQGSPRPPDRPPSATLISRMSNASMEGMKYERDSGRPEDFGSTILESKILTLSDENRTLNRVCASQRAELDALAERIEVQKKEKAAMEASHNAAMSDLLDMKLEGMTSASTPSRDKGGVSGEAGHTLAVAALTAQLAERDAEVEELRRIIIDRALEDEEKELEEVEEGEEEGGEGEEGEGDDEVDDDDLDFHTVSQMDTGVMASDESDDDDDIKDKDIGEMGTCKGREASSNPISDCSSANSTPYIYEVVNAGADLGPAIPAIPYEKGASSRITSTASPAVKDITAAVAELYEGRDKLCSLPLTPQRGNMYRTVYDGSTFYDMDNSRDEESYHEGDSMVSNNDDCISPPKMSRSLSLSLAQGRPYIRSHLGILSRSQEHDDDQEMRVSYLISYFSSELFLFFILASLLCHLSSFVLKLCFPVTCHYYLHPHM